MTRNATGGDTQSTVHKSAGKFIGAKDSRNRRVKGLQIRNDRFYALLWSDIGGGKKGARRFPLLDSEGNPCQTLNDAKEALEIMRHTRRTGDLPSVGRKPNMAAAVAEYLESETLKGKSESTQGKEDRALQMWKSFLGESARLDSIATHHISGFKALRRKGGMIAGKKREPASLRTVQIEFMILGNFLRFCKSERNWITRLPDFPEWRRMEIPTPPRRPLISPEGFHALLDGCAGLKNGVQLSDLLKLLAYSGAREQEALRLRWPHIDFKNKKIHLGASVDFESALVVLGKGGDTKTGAGREVQMNPQLEELLVAMLSRRAPDSEWLFPSPQRGEKDIRAKNLRNTLHQAMTAAGNKDFGFHDCRHLFISYCIMEKVTLPTIVKWVGHKDGGKLIIKTYGHLLDEHLSAEAATVRIAIPSPAKKQTGDCR